jgi:hypothetical protein
MSQVLISGVSRSWRSHNEWVQNGKPNFEVLGKLFGDAVVSVWHKSNSLILFGQRRIDKKLTQHFLLVLNTGGELFILGLWRAIAALNELRYAAAMC